MLKLIIFLCTVTFVRCAMITLDEYYDLNLSNECIPTLPASVDADFSAINTHNQCVQLYKEQHCSGQYLIVAPGTPGHGALSYYGFANNVRSIGPCFEKCHPDRIQSALNSTFATVQIFGGPPSDFETPQADFIVEASKCLDISQEMSTWRHSIFRPNLKTSICVEFHEFGDCSGDSVLLTVGGHTSAKTISFWLSKKDAGSLSFCGYRCNANISETGKSDPVPVDGSVTLFRNIEYSGDRRDLVIKGCTPLPWGWKESKRSDAVPPRSLISNGVCVELFENEGCKDPSPLMEVMSGGAVPYIYWPDRTLKAIKACSGEVLEDNNYCGSGWWVVLVVILGLLLLVCIGLILRMKREGGRMGTRFGGRYQVDNLSDTTRQDEGRGRDTETGTNSRLPIYYNKMETTLIEINE